MATYSYENCSSAYRTLSLPSFLIIMAHFSHPSIHPSIHDFPERNDNNNIPLALTPSMPSRTWAP